jgi:hypothetical protein
MASRSRSSRSPRPRGPSVRPPDADGDAGDQLSRTTPTRADAAALIYNSAFATKNSFNTANYKNTTMDALLVNSRDR